MTTWSLPRFAPSPSPFTDQPPACLYSFQPHPLDQPGAHPGQDSTAQVRPTLLACFSCLTGLAGSRRR